MKVLLPQPDSPTNATDSPGLTTRFKPLITKSSFLVGYLNHTFLNSILPLIFEISSFSFLPAISSSTASISEGYSIISKTLFTAAWALPISGAVDIAPDAPKEEKNKMKSALKTS